MNCGGHCSGHGVLGEDERAEHEANTP